MVREKIVIDVPFSQLAQEDVVIAPRTALQESMLNRSVVMSAHVPVPLVQVEIVCVAKIIPQERVRNRIVELILDEPAPPSNREKS